MDVIMEHKGVLEHGDINMEAFMDALAGVMAETQTDPQGKLHHFEEIGPREGYATRFLDRPVPEVPNPIAEAVYEVSFESLGSTLRYHIRLLLATTSKVLGFALKIARKLMKNAFTSQIVPQFITYMERALYTARRDE
jgi:hypothetical protein